MTRVSKAPALSRRAALTAGLAAMGLPRTALASRVTEITWDDLIPPGVPYAEIIGEGEMDIIADTWAPIFDENARKLNDWLDGKMIKMPGFIIPLAMSSAGVSEFILVPYVGACIHVPPPPPNQLVFVTAEDPWPSDDLWEAVWVTGEMSNQFQDTDVAETGYTLRATEMEVYVW